MNTFTSKRKHRATGLAILMAVSFALLALPIGQAAAATGQISLEDAKGIALAHAGLSAGDVAFTKQKLDWDDGCSVYEIKFNSNGIRYEYEIDAATSEITEYSRKAAKGIPQGGGSYIGLEAAKQLALNEAGLTAEGVSFTKAKQGRDNGKAIYDIEFISGNTKYDFELDAISGAVTEYSKKTVSYKAGGNSQSNNPTTGQGSEVGLEAAKRIAFGHAGVAEQDVTMRKAKLDYDDGIAEYDIEFTCNGYKYEYEINARTGSITDADIERNKR